MHRRGIGEGDFIQFPDVIGDEPTLKVNPDFPFLHIHLDHLPDVTVVDIFVVIIDRLEDFIARRVGPAKPRVLCMLHMIEDLLDHAIECSSTKSTSVHRCQNLNIPNRMESEALGNPFSYHPQELGLDLLRTVCRNNIKISNGMEIFSCPSHYWHL